MGYRQKKNRSDEPELLETVPKYIFTHLKTIDDTFDSISSMGTAAKATATAALKIKCRSDECRFGLGRTIRHEIIYMAEPPNDETY